MHLLFVDNDNLSKGQIHFSVITLARLVELVVT